MEKVSALFFEKVLKPGIPAERPEIPKCAVPPALLANQLLPLLGRRDLDGLRTGDLPAGRGDFDPRLIENAVWSGSGAGVPPANRESRPRTSATGAGRPARQAGRRTHYLNGYEKNWRPAYAGRQNQTQGVEASYARGITHSSRLKAGLVAIAMIAMAVGQTESRFSGF